MTISKDRNKDCCSQSKNRVYLFIYEAEGNCGQIPWNREKSGQGFYILLGSFLLMVSLCILCFDLILQEPTEGSVSCNAKLPNRRHYNTPVTTLSTPLLSQREYWI